MTQADPSVRDTIRLPEPAIRAFLDVLDREEASEARLTGESSHRSSRRMRPPSCEPIVLEVSRPGEGTVRFAAIVRNISAGGMSVVHGVFLHPNVNCVLQLRTIDGEKTSIVGRLTRCRYAGAQLHESGIQFERPIEISHYVKLDEDSGAAHPVPSAAPSPATSPEIDRIIALTTELQELVRAKASIELVGMLLDRIRDACTAVQPAPPAPTS